ncbi:hypothetical protein D9613_009304 [Agrocybe pediades]|uniref:GmrSD restriction endonucleases N-terminal domain-containing protein n=1 Tax=Agrocybe pediades TaxID=84607 RepID=A0A8H4R3J1_9AGAR|nr:hypothetical protein D9613_009304 [Agrocybe pediades]
MPPTATDNRWDDDDELTELSDSDDEEVEPPPPPPPPPSLPLQPPVDFPPTAATRAKTTRPSTQKATQESRQRGGLQTNLPQSIPPPRTTTYATAALHDLIESGLIDLNAEYQRGVVWNDTKQMGLIDSIFRNFHIPPIIFTCTLQDDGSEYRVCVDGKQRLTSIHRFLKGEIAYRDPTTGKKWYFCGAPGSRRKVLSAQIQGTFKNKQIACVEYGKVEGHLEREIFNRVQLGVTLGPSDRLPAINSPYADLVRGLRRDIDANQGLEGYLTWGQTRGKDFYALAQVLYLIAYGADPKKAEPTTSRLEAFLNRHGGDLNTLRSKAQSTMETFCSIIRHPVYGKPLAKNLAPIEFVMSAYLVYLYRTYSEASLSLAMAGMRDCLAQAFPSRKFKTDAFKFLLSYVTKQVPKLITQMKADTDAPAAASTVTPSPVKRKRGASNQNVAEDVPPVKKARTATKPKAEPKPKPTSSAPEIKCPVRALSRKASSSSTTLPAQTEKPKAKAKPATARAKAQTQAPSSSNSSGVKVKKSTSTAKMDIDAQVATPSVMPKRPSPGSREGSVNNLRAINIGFNPFAGNPYRAGRLPALSSVSGSNLDDRKTSGSHIFNADTGNTPTSNLHTVLTVTGGTPVESGAALPTQRAPPVSTAPPSVSHPPSPSTNPPPVSSGASSSKGDFDISNGLKHIRFKRKTFDTNSSINPNPGAAAAATSTIPTTAPVISDPAWLAEFEMLKHSLAESSHFVTHNPSSEVLGYPNGPGPTQSRSFSAGAQQPPPAGVYPPALRAVSAASIPTATPPTRDPRQRPGSSSGQTHSQAAKAPFTST